MTNRTASLPFILVTIALDALGFGIIIPIMPNLVMHIGHLPASAASFWLGALLTAYSAMLFVAAPVLGGLSDHFGRRPVLLLSLSGLGTCALLTGFAPSLFWLFPIRMAAGAVSGNITAATAYIADITPPEQRAARFGLVGAMFGLGFVLGPAIGGILGGMDVRLPFIANAALAACNVAYGFVFLPESLPPERRRRFDWRRANPLGTIHAVFHDGATIRLGIAWCCFWFALGAQQSSFILANELRFHWTTLHNGLVMALSGITAAVTQGVLVRRVVARIGPRRTAILGFSCSTLGYGCYAAASASWLVYCGLVILGLGALGNPAVQSMLSATTAPQRQGETQGGLSSLQGLMTIMAPLTMGSLFEYATRPGATLHFAGAPFLLASAICLGGALTMFSLKLPAPASTSADVD